MGSFYDDFKKKQNKSQNKPTLIKVPQVAPKSNDRRATAAHNREQQRVQAHQNAQRPASTYLTGGSVTRSQPYAASQQNQLFSLRFLPFRSVRFRWQPLLPCFYHIR